MEKNNSMGYDLLSDFKFYSNYSKFNNEKNRSETWEESVNRVFGEMHEIKFKEILEKDLKFKEYYEFAKNKYKEKFVLASQRSLQFGGAPILKHNSKMFNCLGSYCDRSKFFQETMYWLLSGCGVGFSVQKSHIIKLPKIKKRSNRAKVFVIEDSIEGWSDAIGVLMSSYFETDAPFPKYHNCYVSFDYSQIRPKGSHISGGFKAPGHEGLRNSINKIEELLEKELDKPNFDGTISTIVAYDIVMHLCESVLSGGVRRCLAGNTEVLTKSGLIKIKNIVAGDIVLTDDKSWQKVTNTFNNGIQDLWKIKTNLGNFYSTENHKWAIANDLYGDKTWIETSNINVGDSLIFNSEEIKFNYTTFPKSDIYEVPELNTETAWFFGYFLGNGSVSKRLRTDVSSFGIEDNKFRISIPRNYNNIVTKATKLFELFTTKISKTEKLNAIELSSSKRNLTDYFLQFKQVNKSIEIPNFIKQNTLEIREAFLAGLLDSDGSVRNALTKDKKGTGQISLISTKYYDFAREIQILYSTLGIPTKLQEKLIVDKSPEYVVKTISSYYRELTYNKLIDYSIKLQDDYVLTTSTKEKNGIYFPKRLASKHGEISNVWISNDSCSMNKIVEYLGKIPFIPAVVESITPCIKEDHVYDIEVENNHCFFADGVLTHNSATICMFSPDDDKMLKAKTGNWFIENPQRARSNNTVSLNRNTITKEEFHKYFESIKQFGEPGFGFVENEDIIYNPCFEISFLPKTEANISGFQGCNLVEINGGKCKTEDIFLESCKAAAIIGTMQAAYTDFKYVGPETKEIFDREALLGCSITGIMNNPDILLDPEIQRKGAKIIKEINKEVAKMIGIRQAARTTCLKPSGNASVLLSTSSGIHGEHSPLYIRNVQVNKEDDVAKYFKEVNPKMVEDSVWSSNGTDWVISFPIRPNEKSIFKDQLNGVNLLKCVKLTQQNWVEEGTNVELCRDPKLRHNVSNTIQVDDWEEVENYIFENKEFFAGVSLLSMTGDKDYNQAPFTAIFTPKELVEKYGDATMFASGLIVDGLAAFNDNLWVACDTVMGLGEKMEYSEAEVIDKLKTLSPRECWEKLGFKNGTLDALAKLYIKPEVEEFKRYMDSKLNGSVHNYLLKKDWVRRAKQFSDRYFTSIKSMTYCLKDVQNYHKYLEINRELTPIDWENVNIKPKYTDIDTLGSISCAGGACEII